MSIRLYSLSVGLGLLLSSSAFAGSISSTFSSSSEGWMVGDIDNVMTKMESPTYHATGGNPGGYISTTDDYNIVGFFAPSAFRGNQLAAYGGTFSFDLSDASSDKYPYAALYLYGDGKVISVASTYPGTTFTPYSFKLTEAGFDYYGSGSYQGTTPVSQADFKDVLSHLTNVAILADWQTGGDLTALDNVTLSSGGGGGMAVPLPASAPMFGGALVALGAVGYGLKRKKQAAAA